MWACSALLRWERLGVTEERRRRKEAELQRAADPTGYMEENAFIHYMKEVPMASLQEFLNAFDEAQKKYASYGITTVQEGMTVREILPFYQALTRQKILDLDVVLYADLAAREEMLEALEYREGYRDHVRLGGWKIFLDGSPQSRTAWMREPMRTERMVTAVTGQ